jgi:TAP-like protein
MPCANWDIEPGWTFDSEIAAENTSHPMLFLSNTRDPVTPLWSARSMAKKFGGAVVFGQDADGHCTISQPSTCVMKGVREYFQTGRLPEGEIACKPDIGPFDIYNAAINSEERVLSEATHELASRFRYDLPLGVSF